MNSENLNRLRIAVNQFYLNKYMDLPLMEDAEYDSLAEQYESETNNSVKELIEFEKKMRQKNEIKIGLDKEAVSDNNLRNAVEKYIKKHDIKDYYLNLKYDGCAVIALYKNGVLYQVRSTPDEDYGIIRTDSMMSLFPQRLADDNIIAIQGEALVDYTRYGEKARNKANGLVNSEEMKSEVYNELIIRAYKVYFKGETTYNPSRSMEALDKLPTLYVSRKSLKTDPEMEDAHVMVPVFAPALKFKADDCPKGSLVSSDEGNFQCDGVVLYSEKGAHGFKFYFTESAIVTIKKVVWQKQDNDGWMPKLRFDTVSLNDKRVSQAASGGVPNLLKKKMGVGAKVRVIMSKMTIPKIIEVLEPSEVYDFPVCGCGHQITKDDIVGSTVKCPEYHCTAREKSRLNKVVSRYKRYLNGNSEIEDNKDVRRDFLEEDVFKVIDIVLQIDRWEAKKQLKKDPSLTSELLGWEFWTNADYKSAKLLKEFFLKRFKFSGLALKMLNNNVGVAHEVILQFLYDLETIKNN